MEQKKYFMCICAFYFFHLPTTADFLHCFTILKLECNFSKVMECDLKDKVPLQLLIEKTKQSNQPL